MFALISSDDQGFNPLDRGNLYQIEYFIELNSAGVKVSFQSPRSGKFVSNDIELCETFEGRLCFNPLDRGNLYLILFVENGWNNMGGLFNPLDRGNLYLMN